MLPEQKYRLSLTERCQFAWRNVVLRNYTKEEILLERALEPSNTLTDFINASLNGLQIAELDDWAIWNVFKKGFPRKKTTTIKITFREVK